LPTGATVPEIYPNGIMHMSGSRGKLARPAAEQEGWVRVDPPDWMPEIIEWPVKWTLNFWQHSREDMEARIRQRDELRAWVAALGATVTEYFVAQPPGSGQNLDLTWAIWPGRLARFWITLQPGGGQSKLVAGLRQLLLQLPVPDVKAPLLSHFAFLIWGGAGVSTSLMSMDWLGDYEGPGASVGEILQNLKPR